MGDKNNNNLYNVHFKIWNMPKDVIIEKLDNLGLPYGLSENKFHLENLSECDVELVRKISDENESILFVEDIEEIKRILAEREANNILAGEQKYNQYDILVDAPAQAEKNAKTFDGKKHYYLVKKATKDKQYFANGESYKEYWKYWVDSMIDELGGESTGSFNVEEDNVELYTPTKEEIEKLISRYEGLAKIGEQYGSSNEYNDIISGLKEKYKDVLESIDTTRDYLGEIKDAIKSETNAVERKIEGLDIPWSLSYDYGKCDVHIMFGDGTNKIETGLLKVDITRNYGSGEYAAHRGFEINVTSPEYNASNVVDKIVDLCGEINIHLTQVFSKQFEFYKGLILGFLKADKINKRVINSNINELERLVSYAPEYYPQYATLMLDIPKKLRPSINPYNEYSGIPEVVEFLKEQNKNVFEYLPVKNYDLPRYNPFTVEPEDKTLLAIHKNAVASDDLRPKLLGTNFNKYGAISTDGHIMLFTAYRDGDNAHSGNYCYTKTCFEQKESVESAGFPDWEGVIPVKNQHKIIIDAHALYNFIKNADNLQIVSESNKMVGIKSDLSSTIIAFNVEYLIKAIECIIKLGHDKLEMAYEAEYHRGVLIYPTGTFNKLKKFKSDFVLLMPTIIKDVIIPVFDLNTGCVSFNENPASYCFDLIKVEHEKKHKQSEEEKAKLRAEIEAIKMAAAEKEAAELAKIEAEKAEQERIAKQIREEEVMNKITDKARKIKTKKEAKAAVKQAENFTVEELQSTIEASEITLEFVEGKERESLQDYIDGLKVILDMKKSSKPSGKIKMKSIKIYWAEGDNSKYDKFPKEYSSWKAANEAILPIYADNFSSGYDGGYNKVKFIVLFEDGEGYTGRLDVSEKEDNPMETNNVVGKHIFDYLTYLKNHGSVNESVEADVFLEHYDLGINEQTDSPIISQESQEEIAMLERGISAAEEKLASSCDDSQKKDYLQTIKNNQERIADIKSGKFKSGGGIYGKKIKKGDKVKTREGKIETVSRINGNGNIETLENDYSWAPESLVVIEKMENGGGIKDLSDFELESKIKTLVKEKASGNFDKKSESFLFDLLAEYNNRAGKKLFHATYKNVADDKTRKEILFLIAKGYSIDTYSEVNRDAFFEVGDESMIMVQGSKGKYPNLEIGIAYFIEDFQEPISKKMLRHIKSEFGKANIKIYTNAGVEIKSTELKGNKDFSKGIEWEGITIVKVPYDFIEKLENGGNVWTSEQREDVAKLDAEFEEAVKKEGINRNSKEASTLWRKGGFAKKMAEIFGKEYVPYSKGGNVDNSFQYMMLGRLQSDNDYFLGHGNRNEKRLWAGSVDEQIKEMKRLWNNLEEKPEWLSMDDILDYEKKMKQQYSKGGQIGRYDERYGALFLSKEEAEDLYKKYYKYSQDKIGIEEEYELIKPYLDAARLKPRGNFEGYEVFVSHFTRPSGMKSLDHFDIDFYTIFKDGKPVHIMMSSLLDSVFYDMSRKFGTERNPKFNYYEKGGEITKEDYNALLNEYDKVGAFLEDTEDTGDLTERARLKAKLREIESKIHRYERSYGEGGSINNELKELYGIK